MAIWTLWLASVAAAFVGGRWSGVGHSTGPVLAEHGAAPGRAATQFVTSAPVVAPVPRAADLMQGARQLIREGAPYEALALVRAHLEEHVGDASALFLYSDLLQMTGDVEASLEPLLTILRAPPTPEDEARARQRLQLLINAREQQLIHAGDLAGLVRYFERLVLAEPTWDGHRLRLARWLARSGELDESARLLREVGSSGVEQAEIDALAAEIELAGSALPIEHQGGSLYARVAVAGSRGSASYRLLVDTGASMTGLSTSTLVALGAELVAEGVMVRTAAGEVELPVYRLRELRLGALVVRDLSVLGFDSLPAEAEGLVGTDVLQQLSGGLPAAVGMPGFPR